VDSGGPKEVQVQSYSPGGANVHNFNRTRQLAPMYPTILCRELCNKSSAVAEMGDRVHNRHGPKRGEAAVPLSGGSVGSPSNTMWHGLRPTFVPSGI